MQQKDHRKQAPFFGELTLVISGLTLPPVDAIALI